MIKKAPYGAAKAALGCGILLLILGGVIGFFLSFSVVDPAVASFIRKRCLLSIVMGIVIIALWKVVLMDADW
jgi:hypothetical protein